MWEKMPKMQTADKVLSAKSRDIFQILILGFKFNGFALQQWKVLHREYCTLEHNTASVSARS